MMSNPEIEPPAPAILNRRPPVDVALDILTEKYPDALFQAAVLVLESNSAGCRRLYVYFESNAAIVAS
jgi:hypothetical protein